MDITLFELHVDDASFTAHAPFSGSRSGEEPADTDESDGSASGTGRRALAVLVLLGLLAVAASLRRNGTPANVSLPDAEAVPVSE